jgi:hypothetical protein
MASYLLKIQPNIPELVEFMTNSVERYLLSVIEANILLRHYGCQIHYMDLDDCLYKE